MDVFWPANITSHNDATRCSYENLKQPGTLDTLLCERLTQSTFHRISNNLRPTTDAQRTLTSALLHRGGRQGSLPAKEHLAVTRRLRKI